MVIPPSPPVISPSSASAPSTAETQLPGPNRLLLSAALAGLLAGSVAACVTDSDGNNGAGATSNPSSSNATDPMADIGTAVDGGVTSGSEQQEQQEQAGGNDEGTGTQAPTELEAASEEPTILASELRPDMTLEQFTAECDAVQGTVELHAHCGGVNSCRGFSYDDETHLFTEHTCRGLNTCSGYSCVVPSEEA